MRIVFVRHGDPNYVDNCLTPLGHKQAAAAAVRLQDEGIEKIYSSTAGRAVETAEYTARTLGLAIEQHQWMYEIGWGPKGRGLYADGHPWFTSLHMVSEGQSVVDHHWSVTKPFSENWITPLVDKAGRDFDELLEQLGYRREGEYYRVLENRPYQTVAVFSHGGFSSAVIAHLFNLSFPFVCSSLIPDVTAITVATFAKDAKVGALITPRFEIANDSRHIRGLTVENGEA